MTIPADIPCLPRQNPAYRPIFRPQIALFFRFAAFFLRNAAAARLFRPPPGGRGAMRRAFSPYCPVCLPSARAIRACRLRLFRPPSRGGGSIRLRGRAFAPLPVGQDAGNARGKRRPLRGFADCVRRSAPNVLSAENATVSKKMMNRLPCVSDAFLSDYLLFWQLSCRNLRHLARDEC